MQAILTGRESGDLAVVDMAEESKDLVVGRPDLMWRRVNRWNIGGVAGYPD